MQPWISLQGAAWRERVTTAPLDAFRGYAALCNNLPDAARVLDAEWRAPARGRQAHVPTI